MYWSNVLTAVLPSSSASISLSGTGTTATVGAGPPRIGTFIFKYSTDEVTKVLGSLSRLQTVFEALN